MNSKMKNFKGINLKTLANLCELCGKKDTIFGIHKSLFFNPKSDDYFRAKRYGQLLETPIGVAAGPHTQMAQNIISAWLCGARYIELKTVQTIDELEITRPCIDISDEGYNCEWSQELKLNESFDEYLKAWILIHLLKDKFGFESNESGFIFNMSVGYDLAGIKKPNVQQYLNRMTDCSEELENYLKILEPIYPNIRSLNIPTQISNNLTISTMHGCPTEEIQKIAEYFLTERKFHTTVKLNPTLLGKHQVREILNENLEYEITVPDIAFEHDLKYPDAVKMIHSLQNTAEIFGVEFGIKLTNTLEVLNENTDLPNSEIMVYLSGRALHPLAINLAEILQSDFDNKLNISFCAGVDAFNVSETLECGLFPVTVCSDLLKPGGYARLAQYFEELRIRNYELEITNTKGKLQNYAKFVLENPRYRKSEFPYQNIKTSRDLPIFDCAKAPCTETCATDQNVPAYLDFVAQGDLQNALKIVLQTNPFPYSTGAVCDQICQTKCTRINYDSPLNIREIKKFIAESSEWSVGNIQHPISNIQHPKIAIIGAGPSGLSCAYFLLNNEFSVEIFEQKTQAGGMISAVIPEFRLNDESINADIDRIIELGAKIHFDTKVDLWKFNELQNNFDFLFIGTGAQKSRKLGIPNEKLAFDQLEFLSKLKDGESINLGNSVAVIGGGNSAMDVARAAKRNAKSVSVLYRRTKKEMPANPEEIRELIEEGIEIIELILPENIIENSGKLTGLVCSKMKLGEPDESGRKRPIKISNSEFEMHFDSVISAIGQEIVLDFFPEPQVQINSNTQESQIKNVFTGGDFTRGASSLVNAIGDGKRAAEEILIQCGEKLTENNIGEKRSNISLAEFQQMQATRIYPKKSDDEQTEAMRCLQCDQFCNICVSVCPNLANVCFDVEKMEYPVYEIKNRKICELEPFRIEQKYQIVNTANLCNECGNCATFCPTNGAPYRDKPKFYLDKSSFEKTEKGYYFDDGILRWKNKDKWATLNRIDKVLVFENSEVLAEFDYKTLKIQNFNLKKSAKDCNFEQVATMAIFMKYLKNSIKYYG